MSNPGLLRLLHGGLNQFHTGRRDRSRDPYPVFNGEMRTFSAYANETRDFQKKSNREEGKDSKKHKKSGSDSSSDDESDSGGPNFNSSGIHAKGSDAGVLPPVVALPSSLTVCARM